MATDPSDPYALPYPVDGDVANVPKDIKALANKLTVVLTPKLEEPSARVIFQTKITVLTEPPVSAADYRENDVIFVIA